MSEPDVEIQRSALPYAENVRMVGTDQPFRWLTAGWRDFRQAGFISVGHGLIFVIAGVLLTLGLAAAGLTYLIAPLIAGFMLVGPALTVGFYATSRDLEAGRTPSFGGALSAWRGNMAPLLSLGLLLVIFLVVWMRFSLPMLLDRNVGMLQAVMTSAVAVVLNAKTMAVWAGLVVLFTGAGLAAGYVGLAVTLPLIGHATWHAYRAVIRA